MYFWKVDKLVEDFRLNKVTQKSEFMYFMIYSVLIALFSDKYLNLGTNYTKFDLLETVSLIIITAWGIWHCFKINSSGDNLNFLPRMICLSFPIIIRIMALLIPMAILVGFFMGLESDETIIEETLMDEYPTDIIDVVLVSMLGIAFYLYLASKIKAIAHN